MLTRIQCTNFRGFRELDAPVASVTALLGPNSSGKTTALHAVRLACELLQRGLDHEGSPKTEGAGSDPWIVVTQGTLVGDHARLLPLADWRALFVDQNVGENVKLSITLTFEASDAIEALRVEVTCARNQQLKLDVRVRSAKALKTVSGFTKKGERAAFLTAYLKDHSPLAVFVPPFYGTVREEELRARFVLDRLLGSGDQSHVVRNLVSGLSTSQFQQLNAFLADTVGAQITYRTTGDGLQSEGLTVRFKDTNGDLELSAAGAGLVNLIALFASLARWESETEARTVLFLLDEPEAHLHPRLQAQSAARMATLVTQEFRAQLVLATHSVDILNRLSEAGALLLRCERTRTPSVVALEGDAQLFDELATFADLAPYTAINFLASRRLLFCEGDGDKETIERLAEIRFRNDPTKRKRFQRWAIVRLHGADNRPVASLLERLVASDAIKAQAKDEPFRIVVVLDKDHRVEALPRPPNAKGISEAVQRWSRHSVESVLLDPLALGAWIRALVQESAPSDLAERILAATVDADNDTPLREAASEQLAAKLMGTDLKDAEGKVLSGEKKMIHAMREAKRLVRESPETWQRGKDRARFVLGKIRPAIALPHRNQFPTDIVRLVSKVDPNKLGDLVAAVPREIGELLDSLVAD
jgi:predicted ATPase